MTRQPHTTPAADLVAAYNAGESCAAIGKRLHISPIIIANDLRQAGVADIRHGRRPGTRKLQNVDLTSEVADGLNYTEIGLKHGVSPATVCRVLRDRGQNNRKPGRPVGSGKTAEQKANAALTSSLAGALAGIAEVTVAPVSGVAGTLFSDPTVPVHFDVNGRPYTPEGFVDDKDF